MARFKHTIEMRRPVDEVFAFVTEPANYRRWQPSLVAMRPHTRGPLRRGREVSEVRRFLGRQLETTWTCTQYEPPARATIESPAGPVPFRASFKLAALGERTRFSWTVETGGATARLAAPLAARLTRRELERNAKRLKQLLEAEHGRR